MITNKKIGDILIEANIITTKTLNRALSQQPKGGERLGAILEKMGVITDEELVEALAQQFNFKVVKDFADSVFSESILSLIPVDFAVQKQIFPIEKINGIISVVIADPTDTQTIEYLAHTTGQKVLVALATRREISNAINIHYLHGSAPSGHNKRILIVDDSELTSKIIRVTLESEGYEVDVAHDGLDGLLLALKNKPDLIICDLIMPHMDSYTFLNNLRNNPVIKNIMVIMLTAVATAEEEQKALDYGFFDFIPKPVHTIRVISRVKRAFELINKMNLTHLP